MAESALAPREVGFALEHVMIEGDLRKLEPHERVNYYRAVCRSLGLNELTRPFEYIVLNNRLTLYARKDCTDQLRKIHGISISPPERQMLGDLYVVTVMATDRHGRTDSSIGAVNIKGLAGDNLANALMRCETKGKRRVTLSICGLGWTDETEVVTIPGAAYADVDPDTGEVRSYVPTREREVTDRTLVTEDGNPLWERWQELCAQAAEWEVPFEVLELPIARAQLTSMGIKLKAEVTAAMAARSGEQSAF